MITFLASRIGESPTQSQHNVCLQIQFQNIFQPKFRILEMIVVVAAEKLINNQILTFVESQMRSLPAQSHHYFVSRSSFSEFFDQNSEGLQLNECLKLQQRFCKISLFFSYIICLFLVKGSGLITISCGLTFFVSFQRSLTLRPYAATLNFRHIDYFFCFIFSLLNKFALTIAFSALAWPLVSF